MATSERVYNVILDVAVMMDKKEYIEPTKEVLKECFDVEGDVVDKLIEESPDSRYEVLVSDVDYATAQKFKKIDEDDEKISECERNLAGRRLFEELSIWFYGE